MFETMIANLHAISSKDPESIHGILLTTEHL